MPTVDHSPTPVPSEYTTHLHLPNLRGGKKTTMRFGAFWGTAETVGSGTVKTKLNGAGCLGDQSCCETQGSPKASQAGIGVRAPRFEACVFSLGRSARRSASPSTPQSRPASARSLARPPQGGLSPEGPAEPGQLTLRPSETSSFRNEALVTGPRPGIGVGSGGSLRGATTGRTP